MPATLTSLVLPVSELQAEFLHAAQVVAERHGLTPARWQVLAVAAAGERSVAGIARELELARQSVQRVADDVVAQGWAAWEVNPRHARAKLLVPTGAGRSLLTAAQQEQGEWVAAVGSALGAAGVSEAELQQAAAVLASVAEASRAYWEDQEGPTASS